MSTVTVDQTHGPFTVAERDAWPDDGRRHELVDGMLVVTPMPVALHQRVVLRLSILLEGARPTDSVEVFGPSVDVVLADDTVLAPDITVVRVADMTPKNLPAAPLLAVEVLSPSTRRYDLLVKRSRLEEAGCPSYWVVDPNGPALIAWELRDGGYVEVANIRGEEEFAATLPYPVTVSPARLVTR